MTDDLTKQIKELMLAHARKYELLEHDTQGMFLEQLRSTDNYAKEITQVFITDGWVKAGIYLPTHPMTGQAWYDRFMQELHLDGTLAVAGIGIIEKAAKKASGLTS